jgi:hypothetical protein
MGLTAVGPLLLDKLTELAHGPRLVNAALSVDVLTGNPYRPMEKRVKC